MSQTSQEIIKKRLARELVGQHKILKALRAHLGRQLVTVHLEEHRVHSSIFRKNCVCLQHLRLGDSTVCMCVCVDRQS